MIIEWDDASGCYAASVPDLGVQAQGQTIEAAARKAETLAHERGAFASREDAQGEGADSRPTARDA
jgi:hypothetical protein